MVAGWLEQTGLAWLQALEDENGFAESVVSGLAVGGVAATQVTQSRLGYCWSRLALLFPDEAEFARAAKKSFHLQLPSEAGFRVYDQSFFLLFMAWYFRLTGDPGAIRRLRLSYEEMQPHLHDAGAGGFVPQTPGVRSHNPYMHLLEVLLSAYAATNDDYWLAEALKIEQLFFERLRDARSGLVFEFLNRDWSAAPDRRIEIGHQLEWSALLLQLHTVTGNQELPAAAHHLYKFALRHGFESGLAMDAVDEAGTAVDRRKLLWSQTEAVRHLRSEAADERWILIRQRFFHRNGWSWYNRLAADGTPVEEPAHARLLYHVVTAAAETT